MRRITQIFARPRIGTPKSLTLEEEEQIVALACDNPPRPWNRNDKLDPRDVSTCVDGTKYSDQYIKTTYRKHIKKRVKTT